VRLKDTKCGPLRSGARALCGEVEGVHAVDVARQTLAAYDAGHLTNGQLLMWLAYAGDFARASCFAWYLLTGGGEP
jgi:hypothetical protein